MPDQKGDRSATLAPFDPRRASFVLASVGASASASEPTGSCPAAFEGPLTPEAIVEAYPPPSGIPDPTGALRAEDRNGDGYLCVRQHADGIRILVIDNVVPLR